MKYDKDPFLVPDLKLRSDAFISRLHQDCDTPHSGLDKGGMKWLQLVQHTGGHISAITIHSCHSSDLPTYQLILRFYG